MYKNDELLDLIMSEKRHVLCRICLANDEGKTPLFENVEMDSVSNKPNLFTSLADKITLCTCVKMLEEDFYPKMICNSCLNELNIVYNFKIKCQNSEAALKKIFDKSVIKRDPDGLINIEVDGLCKSELGDVTTITLGEIKIENDDKDDYDYNDLIISDDHSADINEIVKKTKQKLKKQKSKKIVSELKKKKVKNDSELNEDVFNCLNCDRVFNNEKSLNLHRNRMHSTKERVGFVVGHGVNRFYCCTECPYKSKRLQTLEYHVSRHTGLRKYKCDECEKSFTQHSSLSTHKKTHSDRMDYECADCGKEFKFKHIFKRHQLVHTNERNFKCEICNKCLKSKYALSDHINRHKDVKNYNCHVCALMFVAMGDLANHLQNHKKRENVFKCALCSYTAHRKKSLISHILRHTGTKGFRCDQCDAAFYDLFSLKVHKRKHSKEKNYPCPLCDTMFRYSYSVNKHMMNIHKKKFTWNETVDRRTVKPLEEVKI